MVDFYNNDSGNILGIQDVPQPVAVCQYCGVVQDCGGLCCGRCGVSCHDSHKRKNASKIMLFYCRGIYDSCHVYKPFYVQNYKNAYTELQAYL